MTTGFKNSGGTDLSSLLAPYATGGSLGSIGQASATGFVAGGSDLNAQFATVSHGSAASATGFKIAGGTDVGSVFAAINTTSYIVTFSTAGSGTITIPSGVTTMVVEVWGGSGGGQGGTGTGCGANDGNSGAVGGYCRSSVPVSGHAGQTMSYTCGAAGTAGPGGGSGGPGGASSVSTGSFTITTMTANGGGGGIGTGAAGGTASGGNVVAGTTGTAGGTLHTSTSVAAITGVHGTGSSSGHGGINGNTHPGGAGGPGVIVCYFT